MDKKIILKEEIDKEVDNFNSIRDFLKLIKEKMFYFCGEKNIYQENDQVYDSKNDLLEYLKRVSKFYHLKKEIIVAEKITNMSEFLYYLSYKIMNYPEIKLISEVDSIDTLLEALENLHERPVHEQFLDIHEPAIISEFEYQRQSFHRYDYAIDASAGSV